MLRKRFTIIVVPEGRATARRARVPYLAFIPVILVTLATFYGVGVLFFQREMIARQHKQALEIAEENAALKRQNTVLSAQAEKLAGQVQDLARRTERFQTALGFDSALGATSGVGGPSVFDDSFTGRLHLADLDHLRHETTVLHANVDKVEQILKDRSELLATVPSIAPVQGDISSDFGSRFDPITGSRAYHTGLDISTDRGTPVRATADGVVLESGYVTGYGLSVDLKHGYGFTTRYAHLLSLKVREGQRVRKGDIIGVVGSTGRSTGYHLHYEVRIKDDPVDPMPYMVELTQQGSFAARLERSLLKGAGPRIRN
ncbi:MAG: M23 family metallopeptidase [Acidobacteriota bacterium]